MNRKLATMVCCFALSATAADTGAEVMTFEKQMEAAVVRGDVTFLDKICGSEFSFGRDIKPVIRNSANLSYGSSGFTLDATEAGNSCRTALCMGRSTRASHPRASDDHLAPSRSAWASRLGMDVHPLFTTRLCPVTP